MTFPAFNHGDEVCLQRKFWADTANTYLAAGCPDPDYFATLLERAAYWQQQYDDYMAHLRAIQTTYPLSF